MDNNIEDKIKKGINNGTLVTLDKLMERTLADPIRRAKFEKEYKKFEKKNAHLVRAKIVKEMKKARKSSKITQTELAKRMRTTKSYISEVESGKQNVTLDFVSRIASVLNQEVVLEFQPKK